MLSEGFGAVSFPKVVIRKEEVTGEFIERGAVVGLLDAANRAGRISETGIAATADSLDQRFKAEPNFIGQNALKSAELDERSGGGAKIAGI
jgi:hypothetical protein